MSKPLTLLCIGAALACGCRSAPHGEYAQRPAPIAEPSPEQSTTPQVSLVEYQAAADPPGHPTTDAEHLEPDLPAPLTLEEFVARAEVANPAIAEQEARIRALRGEWLQAGLGPNPSVGYVGSEIGNDDSAGQHGAFAGQEFVTGGKLARARAVVAAEIDLAEQRLTSTRLRVATDVRVAYYRALAAQRRIQLAEQLVELNGTAASTSRDLLTAGEIPRSALLRSEVELQNAELTLRTARNAERAVWRQLGTLIGQPTLESQPLEDRLDEAPPTAEWDLALARLTAESPEMHASLINVTRARRVLARECAEPTPNVETQASVQYDYSSDDTIAGVQIGMALPIWNRNQGGIRRARAELTQANRQVDRIRLQLASRLAEAFQDYADAEARTRSYREEIVPRAQQTLDLVQQGYPSEVGYLELITAQRMYSEANLAYVNALGELWETWARIDGLLLEGSLATGSDTP